jgi:hypothetical protein
VNLPGEALEWDDAWLDAEIQLREAAQRKREAQNKIKAARQIENQQMEECRADREALEIVTAFPGLSAGSAVMKFGGASPARTPRHRSGDCVRPCRSAAGAAAGWTAA